MTTSETISVDPSAEEYLEKPYHIELVHDFDEEGNAGWVAVVEEFPGCVSQGISPDEALTNVRDAMLGWVSVSLEDGLEIPEPRAEVEFSGKFNLRLPRSLHAELSRAAEEDGVSLNQFVVSALAGAVHWRV